MQKGQLFVRINSYYINKLIIIEFALSMVKMVFGKLYDCVTLLSVAQCYSLKNNNDYKVRRKSLAASSFKS